MALKRKLDSATPDLANFLNQLENPKLKDGILKKVVGNRYSDITLLENETLWNTLNENFKYHFRYVSSIENEIFGDECYSFFESTKEEATIYISIVLRLLEKTLEVQNRNVPFNMIPTMLILNGLLRNCHLDKQIEADIIKVSCIYWRRKLFLRERICANTFYFLLVNSLEENAPENIIYRICDMREILHIPSIRDENFSNLVQAMRSLNFLNTKEGCKFLAFAMAADEKLAQSFHDTCKSFLPQCKRPTAKAYALVYFTAWYSASEKQREVIEGYCIQDLMKRLFTLPRHDMEMSPLGLNVLTILHEFHVHKRHPPVSHMLSALYEKHLWEHLKNSNSIIRCNAAQVLFDAYPLELPNKDITTNEKFRAKQHQAMSDLLTDSSHIMRIIAIRQLCRITSQFWSALPPHTVNHWMSVIVDQLAIDSSSSEVRCSVYRGLHMLVTNPLCTHYLKKVLPKLGDQIHDCNRDVRLAFVELLISIKDLDDIEVSSIVPMHHLIARLEIDDHEIGQLLAELLFGTYYTDEKIPEGAVKCVKKMIRISHTATRKFFLHSKKVLKFDSAANLMIAIMKHLKKIVETDMSGKLSVRNCTLKGACKVVKQNKVLQKNISNKQKKKHWKETTKEMRKTGSAEQVSSDSELEEVSKNVDGCKITEGLIDIVTILFSIHSCQQDVKEHKEQWQNIFSLWKECVPLFLSHFKGSVYNSVLFMNCVMPAHLLKKTHTLNLNSQLLTRLQRFCERDSDDLFHLVTLLCTMGKGKEVLMTASGKIITALTSCGIGSLQLDKDLIEKCAHAGSRTKSDQLLGFQIIQAIISHPANKTKVLSKHYSDVLNIWNAMELIKVVAETRIQNGRPFQNSILTDKFMKEWFSCYVNLIPALEKDSREHKMDTVEEYFKLLDWAEKFLVTILPADFPFVNRPCSGWEVTETTGDLAVCFLNEILKGLNNLCFGGQKEFLSICRIVKFCRIVLQTGYRIMFISSVTTLSSHLYNIYKEERNCEELKLMFSVLMNLLLDCINSFRDCAYSRDAMRTCVNNVSGIQRIFSIFLSICMKFCGVSGEIFLKGIDSFVQVIVKITSERISLKYDVTALKKPQDLPYEAWKLSEIFYDSGKLAEIFLSQLITHIALLFEEESTTVLAALGVLHVFICYQGTFSTGSLKMAVNSVDLIQQQHLIHQSTGDSDTFTKQVLNVISSMKTSINKSEDVDSLLEECENLVKKCEVEHSCY